MISSSISQHRNTTYSSVSSSSVHSVSLLRILSLATLFLGVRSQLFPAVIELSSLDGTTGFALNGIASGDQSGISVSGAGDVNADGVADLIIGAQYAGYVGQSYVVFGKSSLGFSRTLELSNLDGTNGFVFNGIAGEGQIGYSVSSAGDVNADGIDDLIIGSYSIDYYIGRAYVVFGKSGLGADGVLELSALNGTNGFVFTDLTSGVTTHAFGISVSSAGDVNADGVADLIIGTQYTDSIPSKLVCRSYVVFGRSGLGAGGTLELYPFNATTAFVIYKIGSGYCSVSSAGDINADGVDDLIIGAPYVDSAGRAGKSYMVFGESDLGAGGPLELSQFQDTALFAFNGIAPLDKCGYSVSGAGDVNADGVDDLIIGAWYAAPSGRRYAGQSYVVFGRSGLGSAGGVLRLSSLNGTTGFALNGITEGEVSGYSVSSAGDINADGITDLIIGAWRASPSSRVEAGKTYVVFGKSDLGAGGTLELSSLDGVNGFVLNGIASGDWSGYSVSNAGDVNADGVDDLIIGARTASPVGSTSAGQSYVVFGRQSSTVHFISTKNPATASLSSITSIPTSGEVLASSARQAQTAILPSSTDRKGNSSLTLLVPSTDSAGSNSPVIVEVESSTSSLVLPLGLAGGICALISSVAAAVFAFRFRHKTSDEESPSQSQTSEYATISSSNIPSEYAEFKPRNPSYYLDPSQDHYSAFPKKTESHYLGGEGLEELNRQQLEYDAAQNFHRKNVS